MMRIDMFKIAIFILTVNSYSRAAVVSGKNKYVGCYEDEHLGGIHLFTKRVKVGDVSLDKPQSCINECSANDYSFAGINYKDCYCSRDFPSEIVRTSDQDCESTLVNKVSNGPFNQGKRLAVYETGITRTDPRPTRVYIGCYRETDNKANRLLKGSWNQLKSENSPERCHQICVKTGFRYFGLTYREECFCGDTRPSEDLLTDESDCSMSCSGDPAAKCGAGWMMSTYATGIIDVPARDRYIGCYKNLEEENSFISNYDIVLKVANSPRRCLSICDQFGYKFSGVQNRDKCYCGNKMPHDEFLDNNRHCNNINCPGDQTETCGSKSHIKIYRTPHEEHKDILPSEYLGCYKDQHENPMLRESKLTYPHTLTPEICVDTCKQRGFPFAGLKFGKHCLCDHYFPSSLSKTSEDSCKVPCSGNDKEFCGGSSRLSVYHTGLPRSGVLPGNIYLGCFRDDDPNNRMLKGTWQELDNNTPRICQKLCYRTGYPYFGLTYIRECFCGTQDPSDELLLDEMECNIACAGDSNLKCGGGWRTSIYKTGLTDKPIGKDKYLGCYNDRAGTALLSDFTLTLSRSNSPSRCWNICDQLGYLYAGVERGVECYCGNQQPDNSLKEGEESCNIKCPGDEHETCGKQNKIRIFRTSVPDMKQDIDIRFGAMCENTFTTKNGKSACKGTQIFKQLFSEELDTALWKHKVEIASEPNYEFVTFVSSNETTFVENGKLHIKPQIKDEGFINGKISLQNCTGKPGSDVCEKKAYSYVIIPPILTGRISTEYGFTFKYGVVQIKAKLPLGDWIIPEIRLFSKQTTHDGNHPLAEIRLAMANGNQNLKCDDKDVGNNYLQYGVFVYLPNGVKNITFSKYLDEKWSYRYHNFTVVWTPQSLSFMIDNETANSISPSNNLFSEVNQHLSQSKTDGSGLNFAPFDREFYLSLGVSVGGVKTFPDDCVSNHKVKPWSNSSPKAMLHFWQARDDWLNTWTSNKTLLQVEHIKIYAL